MKHLVIQTILILAASAALIAGLIFMTTDRGSQSELLLNEDGQVEEFAGPLSTETIDTKTPMTPSNENNPVAVFTTNKGIIEIELYRDLMPITVGNFEKLAQEGFYDGTLFHRVIKNFMIQGGDPTTKDPKTNPASYGTGGPGYTIQDEFVANPLLSNVRGTIAMANTGQPNSGGSQFFINTVDNTFLDFDKEPMTSRHPVFGHVIAGLDIVDAIAASATGERDVPMEPVIIESLVIRE